MSFADKQIDVLKEVGNIGSGHAATALSQMLNKPVEMRVPTVRMVPFPQVADLAGGAEQVVAAIYLRVGGDASANMFFIFSLQSVEQLLSLMAGSSAGAQWNFSEMEISALTEMGNILAGSYLTALSDLTGLSLGPSVPSFTIDMAGAILSSGLLQSGVMGDYAICIDTLFIGERNELDGRFFLIPDPDSIDILFSALGASAE